MYVGKVANALHIPESCFVQNLEELLQEIDDVGDNAVVVFYCMDSIK